MHFYESNSQQHNQYIPVFTNLSQIYSDIEGEICSKQSTLFNRLKNNFTSLYSGLLPSHYVIVNHVLSLSDFAHSKTLLGTQIKMATENGIILLVKQTYFGEKIFINGLFEHQLIFDPKGCLSPEERSSLSNQNDQILKEISKVIQLANDELALNKLYGATILAYSTISESTQHYKQKLLLGIFLSTLTINQQLNSLSLDQIYHKLYQSHLFSLDFLETQFMPFNRGELIITKQIKNQENQYDSMALKSFKILNKQKLLFLDVNFTQQQLEKIRKNSSKTQLLLTKIQMRELEEFCDLTVNKMDELQQGTIHLSVFINSLQKEMKLNPKITAYFSKFEEQTQKQIDEVAKLLEKDWNDWILCGNHLIFCVKPHEIHEKIRILRKFINNQINLNPQVIASRFRRFKGIDKMIFSSSPSLSIALLNPEYEMWFQ